MTATALPDLLPRVEAAAALGVTPDYLVNLVARGRLAGMRPTPRCLLIRRAELDRFRAARRAHAAAAKRAAGLTVPEVALACNVAAVTVRRWIRTGALPASMQATDAARGFRAYRVRPVDLEAFLAGASVE